MSELRPNASNEVDYRRMNCYGYVFHRCELNPWAEDPSIPDDEIIEKYFVDASSWQEAVAILIKDKSNAGASAHMVFVEKDSEGDPKLIHVPNVGRGVEVTSKELLERDYPPSRCTYYPLALKSN